MYSDCRGRLQHRGSFGFVQNAEKIVQVACCCFFSSRHKATVYLIFLPTPTRTRSWSSSHFYSRYITVNLGLNMCETDIPPLPTLLSILKDFPVRQYVQAACDTEGTSIILCVCFFLEHSSDPSLKSTCAEPHMSW